MKTATILASILALAAAHPGEDHAHEAAERRTQLDAMGKRSLSHCSAALAARGVHARNVQRRAERVSLEQMYLRKRKRDLASVVATEHHSNRTGITNATEASALFTGEHACVLAPDVTQGPYYVTGEQFRTDVTESQAGVPMYIDIQVIDTNTCSPLSGVAVDFWHCNATGVYSGVVASGNGNGDAGNINATFLRGIQSTDADGVVQFRSIVPGHYTGRTTHVHMIAHTAGNWDLLPNNTISGGERAAHVGQLFFHQDLLSSVTALQPYASNSQAVTMNKDDNIMGQEAANVDPVVEYVLLGDTLADGIFAWISVGINASASASVQPAVVYGANGGVVNANSGMGGPGGPGGPGAAPSGGRGPAGNGTAAAPSGDAMVADNATSTALAASVTGTSGAAGASPVMILVAGFLLAVPLALYGIAA